MRFGSLFAGIGGFDLGLERAGMECAWQVEIDDFCRKVLHKHWPDVERFEDVRECGKHNLSPVDLICGGFPCQPFSIAGKRRGEEDNRYLWPEMLRVIQELRPRWVVGENVAGIIKVALDGVLASLESTGYSCETFIVPACAVGAPHRRDRVWFLANRNGSSRGTESGVQQAKWASFVGGSSYKDVAHSQSNGRKSRRKSDTKKEQGRRESDRGGECQAIRYTEGKRLQNRYAQSMENQEETLQVLRPERPNWWSVEPDVGRVANGVPRRVDRLRALGNAVVPQVVELIGRAILEADRQ